MTFMATTRASILRGTAENSEGDVVDNGTVAASGVLASIIEQSRNVFRYDSDTPRIIRSVAGRVPAGTDIRNGDRLQDEVTGFIYTINSFDQADSFVHTNDIRLELRRVT